MRLGDVGVEADRLPIGRLRLRLETQALERASQVVVSGAKSGLLRIRVRKHSAASANAPRSRCTLPRLSQASRYPGFFSRALRRKVSASSSSFLKRWVEPRL